MVAVVQPLLLSSSPQDPFQFPSKFNSIRGSSSTLQKGTSAPISLRLSHKTHQHHHKKLKLGPNVLLLRAVVSSSSSLNDNDEILVIPPNAVSRKRDKEWRGGFSLGVDLGLSRTGLALSKGFSVRPLTVLELRGQKLELRLLEIAEQEEVDEFIIGIPKSSTGKETPQSNKIRSVAGRLAARAAERGWRVYLQDEHGTSVEAIGVMIDIRYEDEANKSGKLLMIGLRMYGIDSVKHFFRGLSKSARQGRSDAYAAMMVLERYFSMSGQETELMLPKQLELQEKLRKGPPKDIDFFPLES